MTSSVYVAGGLTGAPQSYKDFLKAVVLDLGTKITVNRFFSFYILSDPSISGENIYTFNGRQILRSDALVAFCDFPSIGMGMEIIMAHNAGKRIVLLHKASVHPSQMLLEFAALLEYPILKYSASDPISDIVRRILVKLNS